MGLQRSLLAVLALLWLCGAVLACSCGPRVSARTALERSDLVAEAVCLWGEGLVTPGGTPYMLFHFRLGEVWKGDEQEVLVVARGSCGLPYQTGRHYILFATRRDGVYEAGLCSQSNRYARALARNLSSIASPSGSSLRESQVDSHFETVYGATLDSRFRTDERSSFPRWNVVRLIAAAYGGLQLSDDRSLQLLQNRNRPETDFDEMRLDVLAHPDLIELIEGP